MSKEEIKVADIANITNHLRIVVKNYFERFSPGTQFHIAKDDYRLHTLCTGEPSHNSKLI